MDLSAWASVGEFINLFISGAENFCAALRSLYIGDLPLRLVILCDYIRGALIFELALSCLPATAPLPPWLWSSVGPFQGL